MHNSVPTKQKRKAKQPLDYFGKAKQKSESRGVQSAAQIDSILSQVAARAKNK